MSDGNLFFTGHLRAILEEYLVSDGRIRAIQRDIITMMRENPDKVAKFMQDLDFGAETKEPSG